eukprot:3302504-Rhodomonas_salina.1
MQVVQKTVMMPIVRQQPVVTQAVHPVTQPVMQFQTFQPVQFNQELRGVRFLRLARASFCVGIKFGEKIDPQTGGMTVYVKRLVRGGPADSSGQIQPGDTLLLINSEDVYGLSLNVLRNKIPGPAGTSVRLGFKNAQGRFYERSPAAAAACAASDAAAAAVHAAAAADDAAADDAAADAADHHGPAAAAVHSAAPAAIHDDAAAAAPAAVHHPAAAPDDDAAAAAGGAVRHAAAAAAVHDAAPGRAPPAPGPVRHGAAAAAVPARAGPAVPAARPTAAVPAAGPVRPALPAATAAVPAVPAAAAAAVPAASTRVPGAAGQTEPPARFPASCLLLTVRRSADWLVVLAGRIGTGRKAGCRALRSRGRQDGACRCAPSSSRAEVESNTLEFWHEEYLPQIRPPTHVLLALVLRLFSRSEQHSKPRASSALCSTALSRPPTPQSCDRVLAVSAAIW